MSSLQEASWRSEWTLLGALCIGLLGSTVACGGAADGPDEDAGSFASEGSGQEAGVGQETPVVAEETSASGAPRPESISGSIPQSSPGSSTVPHEVADAEADAEAAAVPPGEAAALAPQAVEASTGVVAAGAVGADGAKPTGGTPAPKTRVPPPALEGVADGTTRTWAHPKDYFSCEMPTRWRIAESAPELLIIEPGRQSESNRAVVFMGWGELDEDAKNQTPAQLMKSSEREWLAALRAEGLKFKKAKRDARTIFVADRTPGAEQSYEGKASDGSKIHLWIGGIVKRDAFLYVAAVAKAGVHEDVIGRAKQLFESVVPTPPERNHKLEAALVGMHFMNGSDSSSSNSSGWKITFRAEGVAESFWYLTGDFGVTMTSSTSEQEFGDFEVFGRDVYINLSSGQIAGEIILDRGEPTAIRINGHNRSLL